MSILQALFLGIIQGITEFFPVSSSGHLLLFQQFFGLKNLENALVFDLVCHLGTLLAILCVYRRELFGLFFSDLKTLKQLIIGTLPLFFVVPFLKTIEPFFEKPEYLGFFFLITSAVLYVATSRNYSKSEAQLNKSWKRDALVIGLFQTVALFPGISRSGMTISGARILGWQNKQAIFFSFLLSIPAILGASILKGTQIFISPPATNTGIDFSHYIVGFLSAFIVGYLALLALIKLASKGNLRYFVWYCALLGITLTGYHVFAG